MTDTGKLEHRALPEPSGGGQASRAQPRGEMEQRVGGIRADVLGVDGLVQTELGGPLMATELFAVSTIAGAAELVERAATGVPDVGQLHHPVGNGDGVELVLFPDVLSSAEVYQHMTGMVSCSVSMQSGAKYAERIPDALGRTLWLGGWSFGATLAPEVVRQLCVRGEADEILVIDAMPPDPGCWWTELRSVEKFLLAAGGGDRPEELAVPVEVRRLLPPSTRPSLPALVSFARTVIPILRALARHLPAAPVARRITQVRAAESGLSELAESGWRRFSRAEFHAMTIPGDHFPMLTPAQMTGLGRLRSEAVAVHGRVVPA